MFSFSQKNQQIFLMSRPTGGTIDDPKVQQALAWALPERSHEQPVQQFVLTQDQKF
jgi:hypothetical protein